MSYVLIIIFASVSLFIGIGPLLIYALWKYRIDKLLWFAFFLGGLFWFLAFLTRIFFVILINLSPLIFVFKIVLAALLAGIFETFFRVILLFFLKKYTANSLGQLIMTGIGWGIGEAILIHSFSMINFIIAGFIEDPSVVELIGIEAFLIFGGYERILSEIFHIFLTILTFYGLKEFIKTSETEPLVNNAFTRYPKPEWLWIPIVIIIHFSFDFTIVFLAYSVDIFTLYIIFTILIVIFYSYVWNRTAYYPLFYED
ncbi:MAG: YhfC family intramembrane metalloprotease [Promethearchaeota archaeon]|nr:MAG: YhfC family intramembrane metalloprotease [Candidatus Lokiarchaeota archaeon]